VLCLNETILCGSQLDSKTQMMDEPSRTKDFNNFIPLLHRLVSTLQRWGWSSFTVGAACSSIVTERLKKKHCYRRG
jgi:hypothetical protein